MIEYWRKIDRILVVDIDDSKDTVEVSAPLLREMLAELGLTQMSQITEKDWSARP